MPINVYELNLAGHRIRYAFRRARTKRYFAPLLHRSKSESWDILLTDQQLQEQLSRLPAGYSEGYAEYYGLLVPTAHFLEERGCCVFHAVSMVVEGRCWLLSAPSGTGKTTQYLNWSRLHPGEAEMLSGDMPILEQREDGVWVHPSPWNGKERFRGFQSAPLAGIVFLRQGGENRLERISQAESILPMFRQLAGLPVTEEQTRRVCGLFDSALRQAELWQFTNLGDDASTEMLRQMIRRERKEDGRV